MIGLSQASIARTMRALIQADLVSDRLHGPLSRPHSSGSGRPSILLRPQANRDTAPSFKQSSSRPDAPSFKESGLPSNTPSIKRNPCALIQDFQLSARRAAPSINQAIRPTRLTSATPAPSFKPFRFHPINALIQAVRVSGRHRQRPHSSGVGCAKSTGIISGSGLPFDSGFTQVDVLDFRLRCSGSVQDQVGSEFEVLPSGCQMARVASPGLGFGRVGVWVWRQVGLF
jgi:hypothetical protein